MIDFNYWSPTYFAFGKGKETQTGELVRRFGGHKALLHFGGGSVIDSAKGIAIGAANGGEWRKYYVGREVKVRPVIPAALPVGVVLTIAAAGSEASTNSVVNLEPENLKRGAKEADIPLLVKTMNLCGNTLGAFKPLTEDDVAAIYRLCL